MGGSDGPDAHTENVGDLSAPHADATQLDDLTLCFGKLGEGAFNTKTFVRLDCTLLRRRLGIAECGCTSKVDRRRDLLATNDIDDHITGDFMSQLRNALPDARRFGEKDGKADRARAKAVPVASAASSGSPRRRKEQR